MLHQEGKGGPNKPHDGQNAGFWGLLDPKMCCRSGNPSTHLKIRAAGNAFKLPALVTSVLHEEHAHGPTRAMQAQHWQLCILTVLTACLQVFPTLLKLMCYQGKNERQNVGNLF